MSPKPSRLHIFGPVLAYDLVRTARRGNAVAHRCIYAVFLFIALYLVFVIQYPHAGTSIFFEGLPIENRELPRFAGNFFNAFLAVQLLAVLIVTPAYVAGAIAEEKQRRTLDFLLTTDLSNHEIVLGMLAARVANLLLLILTGLPVIGFLQFLGGVDPNLVIAGFAITVMTVLGLGCISILASVLHDRPFEAILISYLVMVPFAATFAMLGWSVLAGGAFHDAVGLSMLGGMLLFYAIYHGLVSWFCTYWAIWHLRDAYLGTIPGKPPRPRPERRPPPVVSAIEEVVHAVQRHRSTSNDASAEVFERPPRAPIGAHPMAWKELRTAVDFRVLAELRLGCIVARGLLLLLLIFLATLASMTSDGPLGQSVSPLTRGTTCFLMCLSLFVMAMNAAGRISREREQQTLEPLFTTPLDNLDILGAKWLAAVLCAWPFWCFLGAIWVMALIAGALNPLAFLMTSAAYVVYAACLATVGLWFSLVSRSTLRATLFTSLAAIVLVIGPGSFVKMFGVNSVRAAPTWDVLLSEHALIPPHALWTLSFHTGELLADDASRMEAICAALAGVHLYMLLTVIMWISLVRRLRAEPGA